MTTIVLLLPVLVVLGGILVGVSLSLRWGEQEKQIEQQLKELDFE